MATVFIPENHVILFVMAAPFMMIDQLILAKHTNVNG